NGARADGGDRSMTARQEGKEQSSDCGDGRALPVRAEGARHTPDCMSYDGNGHDLEASQSSFCQGLADGGGGQGEAEQEKRRRKGKGGKGCKGAQPSGP